MPPLYSQSALATPSALTNSNFPPASNYSAWNNPHPKSFTQLDRNIVLQAKNDRFLEMHPNGIRGVNAITEYCFLTIYMLNITTSVNSNPSQGLLSLANWNQDKAPSKGLTLNKTRPLKVFRSSTGKYLCMDNASVIFQQETYDPEYCSFHHDYDVSQYSDLYYRLSNSSNHSSKRWYVSINKDGSLHCGNVTKKREPGANYFRMDSSDKKISASPPYKKLKRKCCPKKECFKRKNKNNNRRKDKGKVSPETTAQEKPKGGRKKRKCYRNWCRQKRRQFFKLKLKDVNRYYNRCIKRKKEIRHCKNR